LWTQRIHPTRFQRLAEWNDQHPALDRLCRQGHVGHRHAKSSRRRVQCHYTNPNAGAESFLNADVKDDPAIYPPKNVMDRLFTVEELPATIARLTTRLWTKLKTNT